MSSSAGHERDTVDPTSLAPPQPIQDTENSQVDVGRPDSHYAESATNTNAPYIPNSSASGIFPDPSIASTPRVASSYGTPTATPNEASSDALGGIAAAAATAAATKEATDVPGSKEALAHPGAAHPARRPWYKRPVFWLLAFIVLAVVVLVVVLPVWFVGVKGHKHTGSSSDTSSGGGTAPKSTVTTTGGNGSTVTTDDGSTFTYINDFGGFWVSDPTNPFNNSAQPNSWTPPLSESWNWSKDRIYGVNLGGLFELEPFISPKLYQANPGSLDEWTLDLLLRANGSNGGELGKEEYGLQDAMELHYNEFVTEQDIAEIAGAGLNWIRVPIPFWAIESWSNVGVANGTTVSEPFLAKTCWPYILRLFGWARKYGLRINLDLHTIPGSQNGYNHSGKYGIVNFLNGVMGVANAERALEYIRVITEFITQEEYQPLIPMFGIVNEPLLATITLDTLTTFYLQAYWVMRNITGVGEGNGPYISIHDGFMGTDYWAGFLAGSDRISLDSHPYFAFDNLANTEPVNVTAEGQDSTDVYGGQWPKLACTSWGAEMNTSRINFGVTIAGEFSAAINDCGLWVRGVNTSAAYGGNCDYWEDWESWSDETVEGLKMFVMASMDALGDWFFWTWKVDNSSTSGTVEAPFWSYKLGLEHGWIPKDPRTASGTCESLGVTDTYWNESYSSWATGGAGANEIAASSIATYGVWPPASIANVASASQSYLPQYTSTAKIVSLPAASTYTVATVSTGDGWAERSDTRSAPTAIAGCTYPDAWSAVDATIPTSGCGAVAYAKREEIPVPVPEPVATAPPARRFP